MKERVNLTVDPEVADYLGDHDNASRLVNRLVKEYMAGGGAETVIIDYRLEELSGRIAEKKSGLESLEKRYDELQDRQERIKQLEERELEEAREVLDASMRVDNPAVENWAAKLDMTPQELLEEL